MQQISFDLISDLHVDMWENNNIAPTSLYCVVAGNLARDRGVVIDSLYQLSKLYKKVFYIDGTVEHLNYLGDIDESYSDLKEEIEMIGDVVYLQNNVVIADGYAILGTNGWWDYQFNPDIDIDQSKRFFQKLTQGSSLDADKAEMLAIGDYHYLRNSIKRLQTFKDVEKIIIVTHTVPHPGLISHDIALEDRMDANLMGTSFITDCLDADIGNKVVAWCFGHYSADIDEHINEVRFVNNARGAPNSMYGKHVYFPKVITV